MVGRNDDVFCTIGANLENFPVACIEAGFCTGKADLRAPKPFVGAVVAVGATGGTGGTGAGTTGVGLADGPPGM